MPVVQLDDRFCMSDALGSQKLLLDGYNRAVMECASDQLLRDFNSIYQDELNLQHQIFNALNNKGWYQLSPADSQDISLLQQMARNVQQQQQQQTMHA
ncbi:MAG: spore coat protein [Clostridia bacterium]|nr:MAG: spore coat protein [Clostridia bacterium]